MSPPESDLLAKTATPSLAAIGIDEQRWAVNRLAGLPAAARRLYEQTLRSFVDGYPLSREGLAGSGATEGALRALVERDLVGVDAVGEVSVAYPFSANAVSASRAAA